MSARDIGAFAVAAFNDPERFARKEIDLAAESLTMTEVAAVYSDLLGQEIQAVHLSGEEALAGLPKMVVDGHLWDDVEGYRVDIAAAAKWGIPLTSLRAFATAHRETLRDVLTTT